MNEETNLIVGAGITGITIARRLAEKNETVLLIEKRGHVGGNCYDFFKKDGQYIQRYGPHIFHTKDKNVWDFLSRFTEWYDYTHKVLAYIDGKLLPVPFNLNSLKIAFTKELAAKIEAKLLKTIGLNKSATILNLKKSPDRDLRILADYVYSKIFLNYTLKQWGFKPDELDPQVTNRVPIFVGKDDAYFREDPYQGIPAKGYSNMFEKMLNHANITVLLNTNYKMVLTGTEFKRVIITSPLDEFFNFQFGKIAYRKVDFKFEEHDCNSFQQNSVINYPNEAEYTRITEPNKFLGITLKKTTAIKEYPSWTAGFLAYPILHKENEAIIKDYLALTKNKKNLFFAGRLAECRYYDMDEACRRGLDLVEKEL